MKKIIALILAAVLCLGLAACRQKSDGTSNRGGASNGGTAAGNPFVGTWEVSALEDFSQYSMTIKVSGDTATLNLGGETISAPFSLGREQGYQYMAMTSEGESLLLVLFSNNMLGITTQAYEEYDGCTLTVGGIEYAGEFEPHSGLFFMRAGTTTTKELPSYELIEDAADYRYYSNEQILHVQPNEGSYMDIYYVDVDSEECHYMEDVSLPFADGLPSDTIYTNSGFVITDDK